MCSFKGGRMQVSHIEDLLVEMDAGPGSVAFMCELASQSKKPTLELTTQGFMICYGLFTGLHVFKEGNQVLCTQMRGNLSETHLIGDQLLANELYEYLMNELLAAA